MEDYSTTVKAGGMINVEGDYTVKVKWGAQANDTMFKFAGGTGGKFSRTNRANTNRSNGNR